MKKSTKLSAFTLIELLIVIAVIGILAGMLFPAIKAVMSSAQGTRVANNGKQIVTAITSANIDREAQSKGDIWPTVDKNWGSSNEYFARLMGVGDGKNVKAELTGISLSMFAGGGVEAAADASKLKTEPKCIWSMLAGIGDCDDNMPFIWTRNMVFPEGGTEFNTDQEGENGEADWSGYLKLEIKPFNNELVVLARKGASFQVIKSKNLTAVAFLANSTNGAAKPVAAITSSQGGTTSDF